MAIKIRDIGKFNRRIQAEKLTPTQDADGNMIESWVLAYETWAYVGPVKSYRDFIQLQNIQQNSYEVQIRYSLTDEVSKNIRFLYEGQYLVLNSREEVTEGRKKYIRMILVEQVQNEI